MWPCVHVCDSRELWHAVWPSSGCGDSSRGQAPGCRGAVCVQHDYTGDRWDQLCHSTGTHTFDLLCTDTASYTLQTRIKLNYCYLFLGELFTISFPPSYACTPIFWNYLLLTVKCAFCCSAFDISCAPAVLPDLLGLPCKGNPWYQWLNGISLGKKRLSVCIKYKNCRHPTQKTPGPAWKKYHNCWL